MHPFERNNPHSPLHPEHTPHDTPHKARPDSHELVAKFATEETTTQAEPRAPQIGDIVHYVDSAYASHHPAIVVGTAGHDVDLQVFRNDSHGLHWATSVSCDNTAYSEGTWHYPEKA